MKNKIYKSENRLGVGVYADCEIAVGEKILRFKGDIIDYGAVMEKDRPNDPLQIDIGKYIDLEEPGRSVNHSCDPNAGIKDDTVLVAIKDIEKDEEITFDYSTTVYEKDGEWKMECRCESSNCRKVIRDFRHLPDRVQKRYIDLGIVQQFIIDAYVAES